MEIVEANDAHIPGIVDVWKEFMDFHKDIAPSLARSKDGHLNFADHLRDLIGSGENYLLVALDKNRVVGYSLSQIRKNPPVYERQTLGLIFEMAVMSDYRRQGIGEKMLRRILDWFATHNIDRIELSVIARNQVGYSFWKKHGFKDYRHRLYLEKETGGKSGTYRRKTL